ncbi:MAG: type II secretion system F family protein [Chloroflexota bacterium]|nr:type II secretion system F family protein [Chloroflexota bacterium]
MLGADPFWSTSAAQFTVAALVGGAAFFLGWMLLGTAARAKADRSIAARMVAITKGASAQTVGQVPIEKGTGWIPTSVTGFGRRFADRSGFSDKLDARLEAAGVSLRSGEFVVITVVAGMVGALLGAAFFRTLLFAGIIGAVAGMGPRIALKVALDRRAEKLREQLPDVLTIMASSLRAGHSFLQALDTVAKEIALPARDEFARVVAEIRLGRAAEDALEALAERVGSPDFKWAVLAVNIQREVGGNLAEILDTVSDTLRERAVMRRQVKVLTAEGRLSAWVLTLLPIGIALYMFSVNPEYIGLLFTDRLGWMMVGVAVVLMGLGILWMRKIVNIDV